MPELKDVAYVIHGITQVSQYICIPNAFNQAFLLRVHSNPCNNFKVEDRPARNVTNINAGSIAKELQLNDIEDPATFNPNGVVGFVNGQGCPQSIPCYISKITGCANITCVEGVFLGSNQQLPSTNSPTVILVDDKLSANVSLSEEDIFKSYNSQFFLNATVSCASYGPVQEFKETFNSFENITVRRRTFQITLNGKAHSSSVEIGDRPYRAFRIVNFNFVASEFGEGKTFSENNPNTTISFVNGHRLNTIPVVLYAANMLRDGSMRMCGYFMQNMNQALPRCDQNATVYIDDLFSTVTSLLAPQRNCENCNAIYCDCQSTKILTTKDLGTWVVGVNNLAECATVDQSTALQEGTSNTLTLSAGKNKALKIQQNGQLDLSIGSASPNTVVMFDGTGYDGMYFYYNAPMLLAYRINLQGIGGNFVTVQFQNIKMNVVKDKSSTSTNHVIQIMNYSASGIDQIEFINCTIQTQDSFDISIKNQCKITNVDYDQYFLGTSPVNSLTVSFLNTMVNYKTKNAFLYLTGQTDLNVINSTMILTNDSAMASNGKYDMYLSCTFASIENSMMNATILNMTTEKDFGLSLMNQKLNTSVTLKCSSFKNEAVVSLTSFYEIGKIMWEQQGVFSSGSDSVFKVYVDDQYLSAPPTSFKSELYERLKLTVTDTFTVGKAELYTFTGTPSNKTLVTATSLLMNFGENFTDVMNPGKVMFSTTESSFFQYTKPS